MKFSIKGEYVTERARTMFWEEDEPYNEVEQFLFQFLSCDMSTQELKKIVVDILEGTKKLVGENEFDLNDDIDFYKPITDKLSESQRLNELKRIKDDMERNPMNYLDIYAVDKSWRFCTASNIKEMYSYAYTDMSIIASRVLDKLNGSFNMIKNLNLPDYTVSPDKSFLMHGIYLLENPELIYDLIGDIVCGNNQAQFHQKLYEYWLNSDVDNLEVQWRQKRYESCLLAKDKLNYKSEESIKRNSIFDINEKTTPDNQFSEYGLIDKEGNWYSVTWGFHALKASNIVRCNLSKYGYKSVIDMPDSLTCLDVLYANGWISLRNPDKDIAFLDFDFTVRPTKEQINKILKYMDYYKLESLKRLNELIG